MNPSRQVFWVLTFCSNSIRLSYQMAHLQNADRRTGGINDSSPPMLRKLWMRVIVPCTFKFYLVFHSSGAIIFYEKSFYRWSGSPGLDFMPISQNEYRASMLAFSAFSTWAQKERSQCFSKGFHVLLTNPSERTLTIQHHGLEVKSDCSPFFGTATATSPVVLGTTAIGLDV